MLDNKGQVVNVLAIIGIVLVVLVVIGIFVVVGYYNSFVSKDVAVTNAWAKVQTAYQRRADLIPNLVDTVKGYKDYEQATLTKIVELRSQAGQVQQNVQAAKTPGELLAAQGEMSSVLSRLLVIVEAYPDLKASANFLSLQDELAGTENRVKFERDNYNDAVKVYQTAVRKIPGALFAGIFGFSADKHKMFEAVPGAETAPKVAFP